MERQKRFLSKALVTSAAGCVLTLGLSSERQSKSPPGNCLASQLTGHGTLWDMCQQGGPCPKPHAPQNQEAVWAEALFSFDFQCEPGPKLCLFPIMEKQPFKSELIKRSPTILNIFFLVWGRTLIRRGEKKRSLTADCLRQGFQLFAFKSHFFCLGSGPPTICPTCLQPTLPWGSYNCHLSFKLSLTANPAPCTLENLNPLEQTPPPPGGGRPW